jgi:putative (di)nucleoside polyphosphate hydrolase
MFRELAEEVGLRPEHVQVVGYTKGWLRYRLPRHLIRQGNKHTCIGQKQVWFLLRMLGNEDSVRLDLSERPEFDYWQWVDYWYPLRAVVWFKRQVYWRALCELEPLVFTGYPVPKRSLAQAADTNMQRLRVERLSESKSCPPGTATHYAKAISHPLASVESVHISPEQHLPIVPLRRVETTQHPVITRMVISTRRLDNREAVLPPSDLNQTQATLTRDATRIPPHLTASKPRHWSRR